MNASFAADTKDALARDLPHAAHCRAALAAALAFYGARTHAFVTYRNAVARLFWSLLEERKSHPIVTAMTRPRRLQRFSIDLPTRLRRAPPRPSAKCDRVMEIRGAFLACGSLTAGTHGYHLDFALSDRPCAERLSATLRAVGVPFRCSRRKSRTILYLKDFETIVDLLTRIGAYGAVLQLQDVRALRETKNRIHRLVNTEAANLQRAAQAAAAQRRTIEEIANVHGFQRLSPALREIAELRLRFPDESLAELGRRCDPRIGKPTAASRLAALSRLAARLRQGRHDTAR